MVVGLDAHLAETRARLGAIDARPDAIDPCPSTIHEWPDATALDRDDLRA